MCAKWTRNISESGILRKSEFKEKKEELFVFGYSCKLFRDDAKALHIDQGKHLIPWMGDETLKIDRYDARGALHDLSALEAPPGGFDWRVELTRTELDVEQLCDEERYRAMHTDEDEEEMYKEEELKRLHAAGYGQVGFNYDAPAEPAPVTPSTEPDEEPFIAPPALKALLPADVILPDTDKLNAIIEKTAKFISSQGAQMEILLRAKQKDNPQFQFLSRESPLHAYYTALSQLVKAGKWPEQQPEMQHVEDKHPENEDYLHPSLGSTVIESAPSIPSIQYRPSADCDYTMLISKIRGEATLDAPYEPSLAEGEVAPPGTRPLRLPDTTAGPGQICRPPIMYANDAAAGPEQRAQQTYYEQYAAYYEQYMAQARAGAVLPPENQVVLPAVGGEPVSRVAVTSSGSLATSSTGLSLMNNYNTDSDASDSDEETSSNESKDKEPEIKTPPEDVQVVIDKMAAYVARNGDEFAEIVRAKNDPRFIFLEPNNEYHAWYLMLMREKRGVANGSKNKKVKKTIAPVSFSIKKLKEPDPVLPKPALPYESSSDEGSEDKQPESKPADAGQTQENTTNVVPIHNTTIQTKVPQTQVIPPPIVYRIDGTTHLDSYPIEKPQVVKSLPEKIEAKVEVAQTVQTVEKREAVKEKPKVDVEKIEERPATPEKKKERDDIRKEKKFKEEEYRSKSESRDHKRDRSSVDRDKKRYKESERVKKRRGYSKEELEGEIISLEDNSEEFIDLTGDNECKADGDSEAERAKQMERRKRAAEFLKIVGVDPSAAALPTSSLASAMVDTLESLRKKKALEEEKRRKRDKRRRRVHNGDRDRKSARRRRDDDTDTDHESSRRKKRKKEKKHSSKSKKRRRRPAEVADQDIEQEIADQPLSIDLKGTLKELRTSSPTKDLCFEGIQDNTANTKQSESSRNGSSDSEYLEKEEPIEVKRKEKKGRKKKKKKREEREYSEGEWSSDSEVDSLTSVDSK